MTFNDDSDLEDRLRRIAAGAELDPPASLYRRLDEVVAGNSPRSINGVRLSPVLPSGRGRPGLRLAGALAAVAAVVVIAVAAAGLLAAPHGPIAASTWTLRPDAGGGEWTGLEWHDITATSGTPFTNTPWWAGGTGGFISWRGGFAILGGDLRLWLSKDGRTWAPAPKAPTPGVVATIGGDLLVAGPLANGTGGMWRSSDGVTWKEVRPPFDIKSLSGLIPGRDGVVATTTVLNVDPPGPSAIYFSADATHWTEAALPPDLATARLVDVSAFLGGFVATGDVADPNGPIGYGSGNGPVENYSERAWISHDGLTWTQYDPVLPDTGVSSGSLPWTQMPTGRLGAGNGLIYSTDGGATWLADRGGIPSWLTGDGTVSDGTRIIMAAGSGARFYLSEGDGKWLQLQQGGDVGSLPADGQPMLLPDGVLWISANRVYFGQALSGVEPRGTLGPPTTASPGPTLPYPTSTPELLETATAPEPTPTVAPTPDSSPAIAFTTPGSLSGWTGFSWKSGQTSSVNSVSRVIRWSGGYLAASSGSTAASSLWTSSDGLTWNPVRSIPGPWYYVAAAPGGLVVISVDYGARSAPDQATPTAAPYSATVWTSSDGVNWRNAGTPDFGGAPISIAGTAAGIVATVEVPGTENSGTGTAEVEFSTDGIYWGPEPVEPGLGWSGGPTVQSNAGRFFLMGSTMTPLAKAGDQPDIVFAATTTHSYVWWSDDGRTWTRSSGMIDGFGQSIDFGRDGMLLNVDYGATPRGEGLEMSKDGGKTWASDPNFGPLGQASCHEECNIAADGVMGANGTFFVAVKNGGKQAWLSYDGQTWTPIAWAGGDPSAASTNGFGGFTVLPRGVMLTGVYGEAK